MQKSKIITVIISLSLVVGIVIIGNLIYFGTDWFRAGNGTNHTNYSWATDDHRLSYPESITNITLEVYYGESNGTTEIYENITLADHYTTVFDVLNSCCFVEFEIFWWIHPTFFITAINGIQENDAEQHWWQYSVNGIYISAGANAYSPVNNSLVRWYLT